LRKLSNEELYRKSVEELKTISKNPIVVVLDNVRSLNNIGSVFRTSDAFLIEKIYLCGITGTPPHNDINKTALGATDSVAWEYSAKTLDTMQKLKSEGYILIAIEQADNATMLNEFHPKKDQKYAVIFGNEAYGVDQEVVSASDLCIEIPQFGFKHSLNISVSVGVVLWDLVGKINF